MPSKEELEKLIQDCMKKKGWTYEHCLRYIAGGIWGGQQPFVSDVHQPSSVKIEKQKKTNFFTIEAVPILKVGKWTDMQGTNVEFSLKDLDEISKNTNALLKSNILEPPLKLGHNESQNLTDGLPALGYVSKVYRLGNVLYADFQNVPEVIYNLIKNRAYSKVSAEVYMNFRHPDTDENIGKTLRAVALLGADLPAIKGLGDIEKIYNAKEFSQNYQVVNFSEKELKEEKMKMTLEEVKQILPCCVEDVKRFMEEDKITELTVDKLAEYITKIKIKKLQEEEAKIECPEGYKWDETKGECIPEKVGIKVEGHICPKGYKWDEEQNKCVPIEIAEEKEKNKKQDEKPELDIEPKKWDKEKLKELIKNNEQAIKDFKFENDERPPKGWWNECIDAVSDITDTPEALCGWIYFHRMGPKRKQEIEATRQKEDEKKQDKKEEQTKMSENELTIKMSELQKKIKDLEKEKIKNMINELKMKNRDILLPKFDEYIDKFSEYFSNKNEVIKFGEKEFSPFEAFYKFINDLVASKRVIFSEIVKDNDLKLKEEISQTIASYEAKGIKVKNVELAILAEHIKKAENISYEEALKKAQKKIKENE